MRLHIEALFTHDSSGDLLSVNEPGGAPAPRFFLGRTVDGLVRRFRHDVDHHLRQELEAASEIDVLHDAILRSPTNPSRYEAILARTEVVKKVWSGPAFCFRRELPATNGTIVVTEENARLLEPLLHEWIPDARLNQPLLALMVDGTAVAVCCSGRRTPMADEAAIETAPPYRGRGYAAQVVAAWAGAVRELGRVPLYSTSWENERSLAVARKLSLIPFGSDVHIT
jgi:GNAT superfamily N-acetyltransferase